MPPRKEEDSERHNAFLIYDLYGHALTQETLHGGHKLYNFGRPLLSHH